MRSLQDKIRREGKVYPGGVLKVDGFLNHQIDVAFLQEIGREFHRRFADERVTKILTVEASGIAVACLTATEFGVPVLFAKKSKTNNIADTVYAAEVASFTHKTVNTVLVSREYLHAGDRVLILDDFLANGCALQGLISLCGQAGAEVVGCGVVIEKAFQPGHALIEGMGVRVEALARIAAMDPETGVTFLDE